MNDFDNDSLALDFDPALVERRPSSFDPLPAGEYPMHISKIEAKKTRDEQSIQAVIELTVTDGQYLGRKVWTRLTMKTIRTDEKGKQSFEIGQRQIAELMDAVGIVGKSLAPLVGCDVAVKLKVRPAANGYDASNDVAGYKPLTSSKPVATAAAVPVSRPGFMSRKI
jgi:hypothetical protein